MTSVAQYQRSLQAYKGHITRAINSCNGVIAGTPIDTDILETSISFLETKWPVYEQCYMKYEEALITEKGEAELTSAQEAYYAVWEDYQNKLVQFKSKLRSTKSQTTTTQNSTPGAQATASVRPKLPIIKLPFFSGDYTEYEAFYDQFQAQVGSRSDLEPVTKLQYLKSQLKGNAYDLVKDISSVAENYQHALDTLKETYGDDEKIKHSLLNKILEIKAPNHTKKDLECFRITLINLTRSLSNKHDYLDSEWIISSLFQRKLPPTTIRQLYLKYNVNFFDLTQMKEGLRDLISHMEVEEKPKPSSKPYSELMEKDESSTNKNASKKDIGTYFAKNVKPVNRGNMNKRNTICIYCQDHHSAMDCDKYTTLSDKQARLVQLDRCSRCVSKDHKLQDCKTTLYVCRRCERGRHHTALCLKKWKDKSQEATQPDTTVNQNVLSIKGQTSTRSTALPTATVEVYNESNRHKICTRVFFDQGSQCTFITERLVSKLNLKVTGTVNLAVSGFLHSKGPETYQVVRPVVRLGRRHKRITAIVLDNLPDKISVPGLKRAADRLKRSNIILADKWIESDTIENIDLVIGSDFYGEFINSLTSKNDVKLAKSSGGYLIYGTIPNTELISDEVVQNVVVARVGTEVVPSDIQELIDESDIPVHKLWDLDCIGINVNQPSPEDTLSYQAYLDTVKFEDQQYWVRLPWKINCPSLPTNYNMALGQLKSLTSSLETRDELMFYHEQILTQLDNKFIETAPKITSSERCHYIPHHAVKKNSLTTPLRIVFNCSAKRKGSPSLNDCLMTGPSLTEKLGDILLKFRINKYAYSADISKAFLRVGLQECDRNYTRFLWYDDPSIENRSVITYRFKSVLFGATSSPFLLQATLDTHLKRSNNKYKDLLSKSFYVDNFQGTTQCSQKLVDIYENANLELSRANMPLRMWVSNNPTLNEKIEHDFPDYKVPPSTNILGLLWDINNDSLAIKPPVFMDHSSLSRRKLLSLVSSVFDPLGIISPITIRGKLLVREAWKANVGWDEALPSSFGEQWSRLVEEYREISKQEYPRMIGQDDQEYNLHIFCDASTQAYGAVAYLTSDEESNIITSKARVAPVKGRTVPQLELTALQIGTHLATYILKTLATTNIKETYIWSDNEAALQWLRNENSTITYVKNRVRDIKEHAGNFHYLHVPTNQNPADYLSRGVTCKTLQKDSFWFSGPLWICHQEEWPRQRDEVGSISSSVVTDKNDTSTQTELFKASDISSFNKVMNITSNVFIFIKALKPSLNLPTPMNYWVNIVQIEHYREEYEFLHKLNKSTSKPPCLVKSLGLYIEPTTGLIHCRGRLHNSDLSPESKFPVLLPRKSWLTSLLTQKKHEQVLHGGVSDTLASLRETYWIPKGRQIVKNLLKSCIVCKTIEGRTLKLPGPPPLPEERVVYTKPFETVGIDYTGAISITSNDDSVPRKYYVCLFTCATTRAIHLELANDMSALTFLNLLRRFVARRSSPKIIISDNGSNFTNTAKFLKDLYNDPIVKSHFNNHQIEWKFIPPRSPWMGGFYERLVGIVKNCIRKTLFKRKINEDELVTILAEVEMRVNNRPLTYMTDDLNQPAPLTPSHLIHGRRIDSMPNELEDKQQDPDYIDTDILNKRYVYLCHILKHWEKVWRIEYLASLRERFYGAQEPDQNKRLKVGDIVIVQTDGVRTSWPLGKIVSIHPDKSGNVRVVEVMSKGVRSLRTINKLLPLELCCDPIESNNSDIKEIVNDRPRRQAAAKADKALKELRDNDLL